MQISLSKIATSLIIFVIGLVTILSPHVSATLYATANFNQNNVTTPVACNTIMCSYWSNGSTNFRIPLQGDPAYRTAWISTSKYYGASGKSLGARLQVPPNPNNPDPDDWAKQRAEFEISNSDYFEQHLDDSRYYSFAMLIHSDPPALQKGAIFSQVWQNTTPGKHPPFSLRFKNDTNYEWCVNIANSSTDQEEPQVCDENSVFNSGVGLERNVWHEFVVRFRPSVTGQAAVQVWHNDILVANISQSSGQNIGYAFDNSPPTTVDNSFATRVGAYRKPEPNNSTEIILFFDQVKFGTTKADVDF